MKFGYLIIESEESRWLRVLENNVQLCLSAGMKSGLRGGAVCLQVVHTSAATDRGERGSRKVQGRPAAADIIGLHVSGCWAHRRRFLGSTMSPWKRSRRDDILLSILFRQPKTFIPFYWTPVMNDVFFLFWGEQEFIATAWPSYSHFY